MDRLDPPVEQLFTIVNESLDDVQSMDVTAGPPTLPDVTVAIGVDALQAET